MTFSFKRGKVFCFNLRKVMAVRFRKNEQNDSATIPYLDSGDSVSEAIPGVLPAPALPSNSSAAYTVSARIEQRVQGFTPGVSDNAQLVLAGIQGVAGPIPLAGGPLQAAINGLLTILQTIDRHAQNKAAISSLRRRLQRLWRYLCNAPSAHDGFEQSRRDELISLLQDISDQLTELDNGGLVYQSVTQALAGFSTELDHYLAEYTFAAQMHEQNDVVEIKSQLVQFRGSAVMDLPGTVTRHCVILVDATGRECKIPMEFCMSLRQLNKMLGVLFECDSVEAQMQRKYLERGQYDLCIDQGTQVVELTSETNGWSRIEAGAKVVMRVIIKKVVLWDSTVNCNACGYSGLSVKSAGTKGRGDWTIDCKGCDRRYQISNPSLARSNVGPTGQETDTATMDLFRNMHVQEDFYQLRLLSQQQELSFLLQLKELRERFLEFSGRLPEQLLLERELQFLQKRRSRFWERQRSLSQSQEEEESERVRDPILGARYTILKSHAMSHSQRELEEEEESERRFEERREERERRFESLSLQVCPTSLA